MHRRYDIPVRRLKRPTLNGEGDHLFNFPLHELLLFVVMLVLLHGPFHVPRERAGRDVLAGSLCTLSPADIALAAGVILVGTTGRQGRR